MIPSTEKERRQLVPSVSGVLGRDAIRSLAHEFGRARIVRWVRAEISRVRSDVCRSGTGVSRTGLSEIIEARVSARATGARMAQLRQVINGTGVVIHTNLGRAPLADAAIAAVQEAARYTNLEYQLDSGKRGSRSTFVEEALRELTGAEAAMVVNNGASAAFAVLAVCVSSRELIVSRGQLIEIGGSFRLPDVCVAAGVKLIEVGTTNRTVIGDYEKAVSGRTAALMRVHLSNFRMEGFVKSVGIEELVSLGARRGLLTVDDVGSGCLYDMSEFRGGDEPVVAASISAGTDLVVFSGDKLIGGPQCGVIVGRADLVNRIKGHPVARVVRVCKLTLSALAATLQLHLDGSAFEAIPALRSLVEPEDEVRGRAERIAAGVFERRPELAVSVVPVSSRAGGGSLPNLESTSWALAVTTVNPGTTLSRLRTGDPAIVGRIKKGAVMIDVRTVPEDLEKALALALAERA